ncbi:hypothetical protein [Anaerocolumna aminovalerica]|uniref:hypothetical protein n=1 Tax=Anaerocolumna aminovalerica TaxID=1527 RepID=UPI000BE282D5|nr:hypothetical protein [Anaerocolumna aminovalerica]
MKPKEIILQIFTGGYSMAEATYEEIEQKLVPLLEKIPVKKVIIGWALQQELYKKLGELLHKYSVEYYLWIPVFSETGELKPVNRLLDFDKREVKNYNLKSSEKFEFYCPNRKENQRSFIELYEEHFSMVDFDGVFLDKIRYGSFSNGLSGVFSCFCSECEKKYKQNGIDMEVLLAEMKKVSEGSEGYNINPLKINSYSNGKYTFENSVWEDFFEFKNQMIYEALYPICEFFHNKNMKVGMDTFAPFIAYFAGQDLEKLNKLADFIKPMMYRITNAPAGLPFETDKIIAETCTGNDLEARKRLYEILGCKENRNGSFDIEFVKRELDYMAELGVKTYCGIEINRIDNIAPVDPEYVKENLMELENSKIEGFVLSWNLLSAPQENINMVLDCIERRR